MLHLYISSLSVSLVSDGFVPAAMRRLQLCDLPPSSSRLFFFPIGPQTPSETLREIHKPGIIL